MSVEKNVAYGLKRDGVAKDEVQSRVKDMLELVQLGKFGKRKPSQLSGGQRQRVALARSLIKRPKLLLLDEPLGALDKKLREETQFELINIQESLGITFVVVTHDQEEAMTLASRIAVMDEGKLIQVGEPHDIYENPNSRYVADFIGSVNLFEGKISSIKDGCATVSSGTINTDVRANFDGGSIGQEVVYAIRPEKMEIDLTAPKGADNVITGTVEDIAYMGNQSAFVIKLASGETVKISSFGSFQVREKGGRIGRNPKTGEEVPILPRRVLVFRPSHVLKDRINNTLSGGRREVENG
jgi:putrescine transport system ATP-binding protein